MLTAVAAAGFLIGFSKSGVAGTLGPLVTLLMTFALPADDAVGLLLPMLMVGDVFTVAAHWKRWDLRLLGSLIGSAIVGVMLGTVLISSIDEQILGRLIAGAMLAFVVTFAASRRITVPPRARRGLAWLAGSTSGFTSTIAHLGGPPILAYLMTAQLSPRVVVGTSAAFFAVVNILKVPGYAMAGMFDLGLITSTLWTWALIPLGVFIGRLVVDRINRLWFERVALALLTVGAAVRLFIA